MQKLGLIVFAVLVLVSFVGVSVVRADLTVAALTITSSGALTLDGAAGSAITIGSATTTGNMAMGGALTSGTLTLGGSSQTSATTIYGGSTTQGVSIVQNLAAVATESHGLDVASTGTLSSGDGLVGGNFVTTTAGTAGAWASGVYAKVVQGTTKNVNGYLSGAEFEVVNTNTSVSDWFPLVLNANSTTLGSHSSYIALRDYGSTDLNSFLWIPSDHTVGTASNTSLITTAAYLAATHGIRIIVDGTPMWILASTVTPSAL